MANLNRVLLIGNLTRDPETKYTPHGTAIAEFGLAVNRVWKDAEGERQEETTSSTSNSGRVWRRSLKNTCAKALRCSSRDD